MRIAMNIGDGLQGKYYISSIIEKQTSHQILLLVNEGFDVANLPANIEIKISGSSSDSFLKKRWRLDIQFSSILKTWNADVLLNMDSSCNMIIGIPQVMHVPDLMFLHYLKQHSWLQKTLQRFYFQKGLNKAKSIFTPSEFIKQEIINRHKVDGSKIEVIPKISRPTFSPLDWEERSVVKDGYADGREYFLFVGGFDPVKNLMNVLKAFSQFKKWQYSDMKLLITGDTANDPDMLQKIKTFKFRDDVVLLDNISDEQVSKLMAGSYALLYPSLYEGFGLPILEAMQSGTPVITSNNSALQEIGADAVLYVDPDNESEIAAQMIKLYKDEALRERLIAAGKIQAAKYDHDSSNDRLWNVIESATTN